MTRMLNTKDYNALSLAQPTNFKAMLNSGALLWGTGCRISNEEATRIIASTPFHFCFIDAVGPLFHGVIKIFGLPTLSDEHAQ